MARRLKAAAASTATQGAGLLRAKPATCVPAQRPNQPAFAGPFAMVRLFRCIQQLLHAAIGEDPPGWLSTAPRGTAPSVPATEPRPPTAAQRCLPHAMQLFLYI